MSLDSERVVHSCVEHTHSSVFGFHGEHTCVGRGYRIAGNFCMVEIFVYFVLKSIIRKLKLMKISLHNTVIMFYVTMLSCTNILLNINISVVYTKICTNKNYPLYGILLILVWCI